MSQLTHAVRRSPRRARLAAVLVALAALALVWIGRASADEGTPPDSVSKSISTAINTADAVDATNQVCAVSPGFNDMPGMLVSFRLAGNAPRAVIVLFQGEFNIADNGGGGSARLRLTIDGIVQSGPASVTVDSVGLDELDVESHGFNFISDPVTPGLHVARIQWGAFTGLACVNERSLIVLHK